MLMETHKRLVIDCLAFLGTGKTWADPEREVDYETNALFERDEETGIDRHCVMPPRNDAYPQANELVSDMCEKYPDKRIGFAAHSPQREAGQLRRMLVEEVNRWECAACGRTSASGRQGSHRKNEARPKELHAFAFALRISRTRFATIISSPGLS